MARGKRLKRKKLKAENINNKKDILKEKQKTDNKNAVTKKEKSAHNRRKRRRRMEDKKILIYNDDTVKEVVVENEHKNIEAEVEETPQVKKDFITEDEFLKGEGF